MTYIKSGNAGALLPFEGISFSVIMPMLNAAEYLDAAISSVLSQTYDKWELVIVDDGCTDDSMAIAQKYLSLCPDKIIIIEGNRQGAAAARREGLKRSSGDIIMFLDADDYFLQPDAFQQIENACREDNSDMVIFNALQESKGASCLEWDRSTGPISLDEIRMISCTVTDSNGNLVDIGYTCLKAIKRTLLDKLTPQQWNEIEKLRVQEDRLLTLMLLDYAASAYYIDDVFYFYRQNSNSLTQTFPFDQWLTSISTIERQVDLFAAKWGLDDLDYLSIDANRAKAIFRLIPYAMDNRPDANMNALASCALGVSVKTSLPDVRKQIPLESFGLELLFRGHFGCLKAYIALLRTARSLSLALRSRSHSGFIRAPKESAKTSKPAS